MPTYQFRCPNGKIIERFFKISEVPDSIPCPDSEGGETAGEAVRIISGGAGLIFKGSGFYITDYGKDGKKDQRETAKKADGESTGSEKKTSDAAGSSSTAPSTPSPPTGSSTSGSGET
jgi:putative FmdB family regulatory protein